MEANTNYLRMYKDLDTWIVSERNEKVSNHIISDEICIYTSKPLNISNAYAFSVDGEQKLLDLINCGVIQDYYYYNYRSVGNKVDVQTVSLEDH